MSKERIDEIIREHINISYKTNLEIIRRVRKAMEQYGNEQYDAGYTKRWVDVANEQIFEDLTRLRSLVQAQKELIAIYEKAITLGDPDVWELYSKIQKLES